MFGLVVPTLGAKPWAWPEHTEDTESTEDSTDETHSVDTDDNGDNGVDGRIFAKFERK